MTNEEKYKTPEERNAAFHRFCKSVNDCSICPIGKVPELRCTFAWLALEVEEEKLLNCPYCGGEAVIVHPWTADGSSVMCRKCGVFIWAHTQAEAIGFWNRRVK